MSSTVYKRLMHAYILSTMMHNTSITSESIPKFLSGIFFAQVLSQTFATYVWPHDPYLHGNMTLSMTNTTWTSMDGDAIFMPAAIVLLRCHAWPPPQLGGGCLCDPSALVERLKPPIYKRKRVCIHPILHTDLYVGWVTVQSTHHKLWLPKRFKMSGCAR